MEQKDTKVNSGVTRMESVDDTNENKTLFTMYKNLIKPLESLEYIGYEINQTNQKIQVLSREASVNWGKAGKMAGKFAVGIIVAMMIAGFFVEELPWPLSIVDNMGLLNGSLFLLIVGGLIGVTVEVSRTSKQRADMKAGLEVQELCRDKWVQREQEIMESIKDTICYVPPQYRFSAAVSYFVESYENSRIDNLKEAVNLFDTHFYREKNLELQGEILEQQKETVELLENIEYKNF